MISALSPAKVLLLAVHFAVHADIDSLAILAGIHVSILYEELLLRILLTFLPETVRPTVYVGFLTQIVRGGFDHVHAHRLDSSPVNPLTEDEAEKRAKKLQLRPLFSADAHTTPPEDPVGRFLVLRVRQINYETGMLAQLVDLLLPFAHHSFELYKWTVTTVLPYVNKAREAEPGKSPQFSLCQFEKLTDREASKYLLSRSDIPEQQRENVELCLRGILGPWLHDISRWKECSSDDGTGTLIATCPGWQEAMDLLLSQAASSWPVALQAFEKWGGPDDVEFSHGLTMELPSTYLEHLRKSYTTTTLACMYTIQDTGLGCLERLYAIAAKLRLKFTDGENYQSLEEAMSALPDLSNTDMSAPWGHRTTTYMRNHLLSQNNPLTRPRRDSTKLLLALILSAYILTLYSSPSSVRRAGDLMFLRDERDQKSEVTKLMRAVGTQAHVNDSKYLMQVRTRLLWLRQWHNEQPNCAEVAGSGIFGMVDRHYIETEFLKLLLSKGYYDMARSIYEDGKKSPLSAEYVQEAVYQSALAAYDNATNPNRTRGGLKKCDEIIHALPHTVGPSLAGTKRIEALLKATHALSDYRLVLKQGEPFSPVVLRVHSDPISIVGKILEQNSHSYTRLQEFLEVGVNISKAGLPYHHKIWASENVTTVQLTPNIEIAGHRITAMCIEAALKEDDFETAYSFVASRLRAQPPSSLDAPACTISDDWSWRAAMQAGQYIRTERSQKPTHLGTASGNPEIRHLEQRIECLATALRVAPTSQLQEILKSFRRCEEQLDSAIKEEAANEAVWDTEADASTLPGAFDHPLVEQQLPSRNLTATVAARQTDDAPMSLLDLSRATARIAQRNFTSISNLQSIGGSMSSNMCDRDDESFQRVRKRDQLREAATGTLVSGVGWLIGANINQSNVEHR